MKKQPISLLLVGLMLSGLLASACGSAETSNPDTTTGGADTTSGMSNEADPYGYVAPAIPEGINYNGEEFCISYPEWSNYNTYFWADTQNGDVINDACYDRLIACEEALNLNITWESHGMITDTYSTVEKMVAAGLDDYSLVLTHNYIGIANMLTAGLLQDWNTVNTIDLSKPYYHQEINETMSIGGVMPILSSDFQLPDLNAIFFNSDMIDAYNLEDPYVLVEEGKWTLDKMAEMSATATKDIDGNSLYDDNDQYGFAGEVGWQTASFLTSCKQSIVVKTEDDNLRLDLDAERSINIHEKLYNFMKTSGHAYIWEHSTDVDPNNGGVPPVNFADGKALFYQAPLSYFNFMRNSIVEYGILPYPKYDNDQESYPCLNWSGYMVLPKSVVDTDRTGYVLEVLSAESCRTVHPAFFDLMLGNKVARDDSAREILEMMFDNLAIDYGIMANAYIFPSHMIKSDSFNFASELETNRTVYEKNLKDYVDGCLAILE